MDIHEVPIFDQAPHACNNTKKRKDEYNDDDADNRATFAITIDQAGHYAGREIDAEHFCKT
eukprot:CAMPEP_0169155218 /NCGR_PEP_ID=MMETSP1015-20121227/53213_1 /TAXON_ID=342587 /ORGANISM="Karlodinium micrum, Strain CCMP2283" /LENGTH=60 /DNA_ID=CAMNT_0009225631 /DNA_START=474 /DNA_END=652 /DNA_ORIENTATION=-